VNRFQQKIANELLISPQQRYSLFTHHFHIGLEGIPFPELVVEQLPASLSPFGTAGALCL